MKNKTLNELRQEIDTLDRQIIELLSKRMAVSKKIGAYKSVHELPPLDEKRWENVLKGIIAEGKRQHLSKEFISKLYMLIHDYSLRLQK